MSKSIRQWDAMNGGAKNSAAIFHVIRIHNIFHDDKKRRKILKIVENQREIRRL